MPITRGLSYALAYFVIFTTLVALLRAPLEETGVPNHFIPVLISMMMIVFYLPMILNLTVFRPEKPFAFPSRLRRLARCSIWIGMFLLFTAILPFFPANKGSEWSWLAGIAPFFFFLIMTQPLKSPVRLPSTPKTPDSRWRSSKYSLALLVLNFVPVMVGLVLGLVFSKEPLTAERMLIPILILTVLYYVAYFAMLYRIIVTKPHSRFRTMPRADRYRRLGSYILTFAILAWAVPAAIYHFWHWEFDFDYSFPLSLGLIYCACIGTDASPASPWGGKGSSPNEEDPMAAVRRRLTELEHRSEKEDRNGKGAPLAQAD